MRLTRHGSPESLLAVAEPLLQDSEAQSSLLYGILRKLCAETELHAEPYLASLQGDDEAVLAVALWTPPFVMVMTDWPAGGQRLLLEDLRRDNLAPGGVLGPEPEASELATRWAETTGGAVRPQMWQRVYRLDRVLRPEVAGNPRPCVEADRDLVERWTRGFVEDLGIHGSEHLVPVAHHAFAHGGFQLWEHRGVPRSMAALVGETPRGARIGFVYTPPDQRCLGYAAACTAALSQHYLDAGKRFCCLHADLDNPASNSVYQRIGYRPLGDLREIVFVSASDESGREANTRQG